MQSMVPPSLRMLVVGLNHKTAPLEVRERIAIGDVPAALGRLREKFPAAEIVILSTCNRVELYVARTVGHGPAVEDLVEFLGSARGVAAGVIAGHLYQYEDRAMVEHLFHVASSLDSMVVGETQILAQVKEAYRMAAEAGALGIATPHAEKAETTSVFHTLFQRALAAAKGVHEQTQLASGRISIASVAVDLARSVFDRFDDKVVLCIGAGKMSALMLRHMAELRPKRIVIMNRSLERAQAIAAGHGALAAGLMERQHLIDADIILTSTGSPDPIITAADFKALLKPRRYRPVVMIDIAVPRDIDAAVGGLNNVYLYNIDDLQQVAAGNKNKREAQIASSKLLLDRHIEDFLAWFGGRDIGPLVKALYEHAHALARAELGAYVAAHPDLTEADKADLERTVHRLVGRLLHTPVRQMTAQSKADAGPELAEALRELFLLRGGK